MSRVRAAVIGVGYLGRFHAQKFASMDDVDLAAVMDIDPERAREVAREVGSRACASYDELPDDLDAVSIAVPTTCLLYTSPSPRDRTRSRMPSSA